MEKVIFFGLVIPIFIFVLYLGSRAIMTGFNAKSSNRINSEIENNEEVDNISTGYTWFFLNVDLLDFLPVYALFVLHGGGTRP